MKSIIKVLLLIFVLNTAIYSQQSPFYAISPKFENTHWLFTGENDTLTGSWSILPPLNKALVGVNSYYWPDSNKIFICGGIDTGSLLQTSCFFYNINSNSYTPAAPLPDGRWSGKLVRVKDSLYLIGSIGTDFANPDGKVYKYSLNGNSWTIKNPTPVPKLEESAVCVFRDSLIITIGGSTDRFQGATSYIRLYNPWSDSWRTSFTHYLIPVTTAHAECKLINDSANVIVLGGFNAGNVDAYYRGFANVFSNDSLLILWDTVRQYTPFQQGIYRVSGGQMNDYYLFGPGRNDLATVSQIWALRINGSDYLWTRLLPDMIDSTSNIPQIAVKPGTDTASLFFFGGFNNPNFSNQAKVLTITGSPIGIDPRKNIIPAGFKLYQNYPNPFNPVTKIRFDISHSESNSPVKLVVYDILGREITTLVNKYLTAGTYEVDFDGTNLASGVYFYSIINGQLMDIKKLVIIK